LALRDSDGNILEWLGTCTDIDELKRTEEDKIAQNAELERRVELRTAETVSVNHQLAASVKDLESFAYSVSHDLRAPVRHLDGFLTLLHKKNYSKLDDTSKHYIDCALQASQRMGRLIDELLRFSRLGRGKIRGVPVNLNALIDNARREMEPEIAGRNVIWRIDRLPVVIAEEALLRQVIANLLANSLKFTRYCETPEISVGSRRDRSDEVVIFVRDNGAGFDMRYYDKLFQVFQRLHGEDEFDGTGIGLAIVRRVIERHGGRVWAEGTIGTGATFYFSLPSGGIEERGLNERIEADRVS
jgi:light-regulated signal transduction histidine kinase (bacteriophytochrome)